MPAPVFRGTIQFRETDPVAGLFRIRCGLPGRRHIFLARQRLCVRPEEERRSDSRCTEGTAFVFSWDSRNRNWPGPRSREIPLLSGFFADVASSFFFFPRAVPLVFPLFFFFPRYFASPARGDPWLEVCLCASFSCFFFFFYVGTLFEEPGKTIGSVKTKSNFALAPCRSPRRRAMACRPPQGNRQVNKSPAFSRKWTQHKETPYEENGR